MGLVAEGRRLVCPAFAQTILFASQLMEDVSAHDGGGKPGPPAKRSVNILQHFINALAYVLVLAKPFSCRPQRPGMGCGKAFGFKTKPCAKALIRMMAIALVAQQCGACHASDTRAVDIKIALEPPK